jgi:hypothetical protein
VTPAEQVWNAVKDDPNSVLARVIQEDLCQIPAVYRVIFAYAFLNIVLRVLLACAGHLLLGFTAFILLALVSILMEVRHLYDVWIALAANRAASKTLPS